MSNTFDFSDRQAELLRESVKEHYENVKNARSLCTSMAIEHTEIRDVGPESGSIMKMIHDKAATFWVSQQIVLDEKSAEIANLLQALELMCELIEQREEL